jgi:integrase
MTAKKANSARSSRPLRVGKPRDAGQRSWHVKLYGPNASKSSHRIRYKDPHSGEWKILTARDMGEANAIFDHVERWLDAGAAPPGDSETDERHDVAALARRLLDRMQSDGARRRTIEEWRGILERHILPAIGDVIVLEWDDEHCREVLRRSRSKGLSPLTVQDHGAVLVALVTEAHRRPRWLSRDENPMEGVRYRAKSRLQGESTVYVPPELRPETIAVERLCAELQTLGQRHQRPWYHLMGLIAGYGGLRWSELIALRPRDYRGDDRKLIVATSIEQAARTITRERTKNNKVRDVPVTATMHTLLETRIGEVESGSGRSGGEWPAHGPDALLFPGPRGEPWSRSTWRRSVFTPAARLAGWTMRGDRPTPTGLMRGGTPTLPWRNLRHHAATWLHHNAGLSWEEVSHILGHHSVAFTLATYVRRGAESDAEVRRLLDRF